LNTHLIRGGLATAVLSVLLPGSLASEDPSLDRGFQLLYNQQFDDAQAQFSSWQRQFPDDPVGPAAESAGYLFQELNRLGILELQFFTLRGSVGPAKKVVADAKTRTMFLDAVDRTTEKANKRLTANPRDEDAMFAMTLAAGQTADYQALIEKRTLASLQSTKRATMWARQLLALNPKYYDAYIASGSGKYIIGSLIAPVRWLLSFNGVSGDKEQGIREVTLTAQHGHYLAPLARILLAIAYLREHKDTDGRALLVQLRADFPNNTVLAKVIDQLDNH
jgi:tetratricopeptide (TPR) repeat protein